MRRKSGLKFVLCRAEIPERNEFAKKHAGEVTFYAINLQEPKETVDKFLKDNGYTMPVLLGLNGEAADIYRVRAIPTTYVIDHAAGIRIVKTTGEAIEAGEVLALLYTNDESRLAPAAACYRHAVAISAKPPEKRPLIFARITKDSFQNAEKPHEPTTKEALSAALLEEVAAAMSHRTQEGGSTDGR